LKISASNKQFVAVALLVN